MRHKIRAWRLTHPVKCCTSIAMPDAECVQVFATVTSTTIALTTMLTKLLFPRCRVSKRTNALHKRLLESNSVTNEVQMSACLINSTIISDSSECDTVFKLALMSIGNALLSTWTELLQSKTKVTREQSSACLMYHFQKVTQSTGSSLRTELNVWRSIAISDCIDAFSHCMSISAETYEHTILFRIEACAVCLRSKIRLYIRYLPTMNCVITDTQGSLGLPSSDLPSSDGVQHTRSVRDSVTHICQVLTYLGHTPPSWQVFGTSENVPEMLSGIVQTALESGSPLVHCQPDGTSVVLLPSGKECIVIWTGLGKLFIDALKVPQPSMYLSIDSSGVILQHFVNRHSRLLSDSTSCRRGMRLSDLMHVGTTSSVFFCSLTNVQTTTYDCGQLRRILAITES